MKLREKVITILLSVAAAYVALGYCVQHYVVRPQFESMEHAAAERALSQCAAALDIETEELGRLSAQWGRDQATADFLETSEPEYVRIRLSPSVFRDHRLNLIYLLNADRQVVWGATLENEALLRLDEFPMGTWPREHVLTQPLTSETSVSGLMNTSRGPVAVASSPILDPGTNERPLGVLLIARFLGPERLPEALRRNDVQVQLLRAEEPCKDSDDAFITVCRPLRDVFKEKSLQLAIAWPVGPARRVDGIMRFALLSNVVIALLMVLATNLLLQRSITGPIARLTHHVTHFHLNREAREMLDAPQRDELGKLTLEFNRMAERLEREVQALQKLETEMGRARHLAAVGEMGASLAHELRNPLAGLSGAIQILRSRPYVQEEDKKIIESVLRQVERLDETVRRFLFFTSPWEPERRPCRLDELVERVFETARRDPLFANITLVCEGADAVEAPVDPLLANQVLRNVIQNAAEAMPGGGTIRAHFRETPISVCVSIEDNGPGIPVEHRDRVFAPFFTTRKYGTGLGLAICRRIMEAHGGRIAVSGETGEGLTVDIEFPKEG